MNAALANWHAALKPRFSHARWVYYSIGGLGALALIPVFVDLPDVDKRQIYSVITTLQAAIIAAGFTLAASPRHELWRRNRELLAALEVEQEAPREMVTIIQDLARRQSRLLRNMVLVDVGGFIYFSTMAWLCS